VGYLIASSQGSSTFAAYDRQPPHAYRMSFEIADAPAVDGVTSSDGIQALNYGLGSSFPDGVFIAQDDHNPGSNQNFKLVSWGAVAASVDPPLVVDPAFDPRRPDAASQTPASTPVGLLSLLGLLLLAGVKSAGARL
jgi:3-phytase